MKEMQTYNINDPSSNRSTNNDKIHFTNQNFGFGNQYHSKNYKWYFILLIICIVIIVALALFLIIYLKNKNKKEEEKIYETLDEDTNYIIATYQIKEGQDLKVFNPSSVGLNEDDYSLHEIEEGSNTLRILKEIDKNKGQVVSKKNGLMKIRIKLNKKLTNLDYMFESCEDLINIDMSHVEASNITSMIYTFTGCKKMEKINLNSINTSSVQLMDFLFAGCNSLTDISGLETLNTSSLKKTAGMFLDCNNLVFANLSSFQINNIEEQNGMFINNPNLKVVDLSNCSDANQIFSHEENFQIVIIGFDEINVENLTGNISIQHEDEIEEINCTIGSEEKCLECSSKKGEKINCKSCNDGYYLPLGNDFTKTKCKKCDEGCNICYANPGEDLSICVLCNDTYQLYEGKCIQNCEIGEDEKCVECGDGKQGFNDRCQKCNPGYYYDINYNKSICKKIDIDNCIEAEMESNNLRCLKCSKGFMIYENLCFKSCDEGENEKCASCNNNFDYREYCATCNSGYYRNDINPTKCESCFGNLSYTYNNSYYYNDNNSDLFFEIDEKYLNLEESLINGTLDNLLYNIFEYKEDLFVKDGNIIYQVTTTDNQKLIEYKNISVISLGECENILKEKYAINKNKSLIILKADINREGLSIPIVHFEVYHPLTKNKLDLRYCKYIKMNIIYNFKIDKIETNNCRECDLISGKLYCTVCNEGYILINKTCFKDCDKGCENCYFDGKNNGRCVKCKEEYLLDNYYSNCIPCPTGCKYCYDNIFYSDINQYNNSNNSNYQNSTNFNSINNSYICNNYTKCVNEMNCQNYSNCMNKTNCTNYSNCTFTKNNKQYINMTFYGNYENFTNCSEKINCSSFSNCMNISFCSYERACLIDRVCIKNIYYKNYTNNSIIYNNYSNYIDYEEEKEEEEIVYEEYKEEANFIDYDQNINLHRLEEGEGEGEGEEEGIEEEGIEEYEKEKEEIDEINFKDYVEDTSYIDYDNDINFTDYVEDTSYIDYDNDINFTEFHRLC